MNDDELVQSIVDILNQSNGNENLIIGLYRLKNRATTDRDLLWSVSRTLSDLAAKRLPTHRGGDLIAPADVELALYGVEHRQAAPATTVLVEASRLAEALHAMKLCRPVNSHEEDEFLADLVIAHYDRLAASPVPAEDER